MHCSNMPTEAQHSHRRQRGPPENKREFLDKQGVTKKADQGQKRWEKLCLQEHKAWKDVLPLWEQLQWYRYTGAQQGGALFARWPDSDRWGADVWTANVPDAVKELALRLGLSVDPASASQSDPDAPAASALHPTAAHSDTTRAATRSTAVHSDTTKAAPRSTAAHSDTTRAAPGSATAPVAPPSSKTTQLQTGGSVTTPAPDLNPAAATAPDLQPTSDTAELQSNGPQEITTQGRDTGAKHRTARPPGPGTVHDDPAALCSNMAVLLAATAHPDTTPAVPGKQTHSSVSPESAQDIGMDSEEPTGFPRLLRKVHEATQEYVRHQIQECDAAVQRWQHECVKAKRQLHASEKECLGLKRQLEASEQQLQTALNEQEQHLLQQQVELVHRHQENVKDLEATSAASVADLQKQVAELQQHNKELQQDNDGKADFIQSFFNAAGPLTKRPRTSEATSSQR